MRLVRASDVKLVWEILCYLARMVMISVTQGKKTKHLLNYQ